MKFKLFLYGLFVLLVLSQIAATGQATALAIASIVALIAPFILKYIPIAGRYMVLITWVLSVVIAGVAGLISGEINLAHLNAANPTDITLLIGWTYGVTQAVFAFFKDHPLGPLAVK